MQGVGWEEKEDKEGMVKVRQRLIWALDLFHWVFINHFFKSSSLPVVRCQRGEVIGKREMSVRVSRGFWACFIGTVLHASHSLSPHKLKIHDHSWMDGCVCVKERARERENMHSKTRARQFIP